MGGMYEWPDPPPLAFNECEEHGLRYEDECPQCRREREAGEREKVGAWWDRVHRARDKA